MLRWQATEAAELLDTSVPAVNSALQRARATLAALPEHERRRPTIRDDHSDLLAKYVDAFERYDMSALIELLHEDAVQSMPPYAMWIEGAENIATWMVAPGPDACRGSRLVPVAVNGSLGFGQYKPDPAGGLRALGAAGHRSHRGPDRADDVFPGHGLVVPVVRLA